MEGRRVFNPPSPIVPEFPTSLASHPDVATWHRHPFHRFLPSPFTMKKNYLFLVLGLIVSAAGLKAQEVWDNFDSRRLVDYDFIHGVFIEYQPNPNTSGINTSPMAVRYLRNPVETFDVIVANVGQLENITDYITGAKSLTLDVYPPAAGITVQITLEDSVTAGPVNYPIGRRAEFTAVTTGSLTWEKLTFTLANEPDPTVPNTGVNRAVLLVNPGTPVSQAWYFDNWMGPERVALACDPDTDEALEFMDAECEQDLIIEFYHGQLSRKLNPEVGAGNPSSHALRYDRNVGEMDDIIIGYFPAPIAIGPGSGNIELVMDVYDVNAPSVYVMALQTAAGADVLVVSDSTAPAAAGEWDRLRFNVQSPGTGTTAERFVLLYKPGQFSVGRTFIDNMTLVAEPIGINDVEAPPALSIFPNPASDVLRVQLPQINAEGTLQIFSVEGRQMAPVRQLGNGESTLQTWDATSWPNGTYWVRWVVGGRSVSQPVLLTR
ncbi:MAG: T9SS type A sorting domain-containing protein [Bacteroidetes bacterium]|nr:T9SS type A sorting domain-containing protein [Bacteroidota bacterium]